MGGSEEVLEGEMFKPPHSDYINMQHCTHGIASRASSCFTYVELHVTCTMVVHFVSNYAATKYGPHDFF